MTPDFLVGATRLASDLLPVLMLTAIWIGPTAWLWSRTERQTERIRDDIAALAAGQAEIKAALATPPVTSEPTTPTPLSRPPSRRATPAPTPLPPAES